MQKHRRNKSRKRVLKNQNHALDASVSQYIYELCSRITGSDFKTQYLKSAYLSKYADPSPDSAEKRRSAAIQKWMDTEDLNRLTNERIRSADQDFNILPRVTLKRFVKHCRRTVASILGPLSDDLVIGGFSGGASTSRRRTEAHPSFKFSDKADVTDDAACVVDLLLHTVPLFRQYGIFSDLRRVEGAVLFTVPKNSDIDRCACKEPDVNMYLQKGVGARIRRRLLRAGINLNDQSINRDLARLGSSDGSLATLDLSAASDSISIELVRLLVPPLWFEYLNSIRSQKVSVDGSIVVTEMFSSMGNGFTFELESLLFFAISKSVLYFEGIKGRLSVYGDDIICPSTGFDMIVWSLNWFGFRANLDKSFSTGSFRESCGGHYHEGKDVTPFYLKRPAKRLTDLIRVANQLRKWILLESNGLPVVGEAERFDVWCYLRDRVPSDIWGGYDLALDTQLVTPDSPRSRLVRVSEVKRIDQRGHYVFWHNSNWKRTQGRSDPVKDVTENTQVCRKRRAPTSWGDVTKKSLFIEELI